MDSESPYLSAIREVAEASENIDVFGGFVVFEQMFRADLGHNLASIGRVGPCQSKTPGRFLGRLAGRFTYGGGLPCGGSKIV